MKKGLHKATFLLILAVIVGGGYLVWRYEFAFKDSWVKDASTGEWKRQGDPHGPPPRSVVEDCYTRTEGRAYDAVLQKCLAQLCGNEPVCINGVLDVFSVLRGEGASKPQENMPQDEELTPIPPPAPPTNTTTDEGVSAIPAPGGETSPTSTTEAGGEEPVIQAPDESPTPQVTVTTTSQVRVSQPSPAASLTSPFTIIGEAHETVTALVIRVKGSDGKILIQEKVIPRAVAVGGWRPFKLSLAYSFSQTKSGTLEVEPEGAGGATSLAIPVEFK